MKRHQLGVLQLVVIGPMLVSLCSFVTDQIYQQDCRLQPTEYPSSQPLAVPTKTQHRLL